jgi:hypothetical protein
MSLEEHRTTVMEEARARAVAREAAPPPQAPPARRPTPMLNTGARTPLVPRMADGSLPSIQPGHIAAVIIVAVFLVALGLSISAPRQSAGPTLVWPTVAATVAMPLPSAPILQPTSEVRPTNAPTAMPTAASYLEPVGAPQTPAYAPQAPAAPAAPAELQPIADLVPIPTAAPAPTNGVWFCSDASAARPCRGSGGQP